MDNFETPEANLSSEEAAEQTLEELLERHPFLSEIPKNQQRLDEADTAVEALAFARQQIEARSERSFSFETPGDMEAVAVSIPGIKRSIDQIITDQESIGEGGDARVVVSKAEEVDGVQEICYKFAKEAETPRGRNAMSEEMRLQQEFLDVVNTYDLPIGVPSPYYYAERDGHKTLAMERLPARSLDDLRRGFGSLPAWWSEHDVNELCDGLRHSLETLHECGLYHRDLHAGNIMINNTPERENVAKLGYVIDFGLSARVSEGFDPYQKEQAGEVFTYSEDCGRIEQFRKDLLMLIKRRAT